MNTTSISSGANEGEEMFLKQLLDIELRAHLEREKWKLEREKLKLEVKKLSGEAFVCLDHLVFDQEIALLESGAIPYDHYGELIWNSLPAPGSVLLPPATCARQFRKKESKIFCNHRDGGFNTDISGRPKSESPGAQFGHIGPLAPSCRDHWLVSIIYCGGLKDGRPLTHEEARMLAYGSRDASGAEDINSLFTDGTNFIFADQDGCNNADPSYIIAPIMTFKNQLENNGRPLEALVLARDIISLRMTGFLFGKYETLDPRIAADKLEIDLALDGLIDGVTRNISLYCRLACPSVQVVNEKKKCGELRCAILSETKFLGLRYDRAVAGDRLFMKIKFSQALDRSRPYPVGADWHPCPCLGFLALRTANCYVNYLYRKGLIGSLQYESEVPTAVLLPCCTDVLGGTKACAVCRRFVKEHVYAEAYYTSDDDGDAESSDS